MNTPPNRGALLLVEDDATFSRAMGRALGLRGFEVVVASNITEALRQAERTHPLYAVVDLKLGSDSGLHLIPALRASWPAIRIVLLTGYASIATAVEAIKLGADDYLAKPVDADTVMSTVLGVDDESAEPVPSGDRTGTPLPLRRLEWEHIQRVLLECDGNISKAARRLGMHRRTLQRKLDKHPVRERPSS